MYRKRSIYFAFFYSHYVLNKVLLCEAAGSRLRVKKPLRLGTLMNENDAQRPTRKASLHVTVYVLPEELEVIRENARMAGLTASTYLRRLGMGFVPTSVLDHEAVLLLAKVNADQSRLGNLLKMWLADDSRLERFNRDQMTATITLAMERIKGLQEALLQQLKKL